MASPPLVDVAAAAMVPAAFAVTARREDTEDTVTLALAPRGGEGLAFSPGQFTMISAGGAGEVPISISGDPAAPASLVHTVRAVGLATTAICAARPGDVLAVRGPFGRSWPLAEAEGGDVVVAAGGIGLAPLRPAVLELLAHQERYGRLTLIYGGRSPDLLLYADELEAWRARGLDVAVTVDTAGPGWRGPVGVVTRLVQRMSLPDPQATTALLCGPEVMMRFTVAALIQRGVPANLIHLSMERTMQCGIARCGHCQLGPTLLCRDGPVYRWSELAPWLAVKEL